jgi:hypothetical protein
MLSGEDFVAGLNDQAVRLIVEPLAGMVCDSSSLFQDSTGGDHLARNQILADAEVLERALCLGTPELVRRHFNHTEAIGLPSHLDHLISPIAVATHLLPKQTRASGGQGTLRSSW